MKTLTTSYSLLKLKNNPIEFAKIISYACYGFKVSKIREANIFDIYLILPILLYEAGVNNLTNANKASSIQTIYLNNNIVGIAGLQSRLDKLKKRTVDSFIIAVNMKYIEIDENSLNIKVTKYGEKEIKKDKKENIKYCREAINLGKILSRNDMKENYRLLGVKRI